MDNGDEHMQNERHCTQQRNQIARSTSMMWSDRFLSQGELVTRIPRLDDGLVFVHKGQTRHIITFVQTNHTKSIACVDQTLSRKIVTPSGIAERAKIEIVVSIGWQSGVVHIEMDDHKILSFVHLMTEDQTEIIRWD